ncbi:zonadhesin isoform X32 [Parasteatoda tepidariorum]|uniref:zonadhesin isoform X32 n=1 Tax=Parasteatoda tepidariorum TaxID=114398 RepID=UPI0039BD721D
MWSVLLLAICSSLNGDFRPSDCKIICPKNEVYTKVPKPCNTCDHLLGNVPCIDKKCGDPSCQCKPGLYRNHKGKCVTKRQCLETSEPEFCGCDRGEVYLKCGCERNCDNKLVPKSCAYECVSGCFCKKPLVRDAAGKCVKLESCIAGIEQSSQESAVWSIIYDEDDEERNQSSRRSSHKPHGRGKGHFSRKSSSRSSEYDENDEELNQSSRRSSQWVSEQRRGNGRSSSSEEYDEDEEESDQSSRRSSHRSSRHEKDSSEEDDESSTRSSGKGKKCGKNEVIVACVKPKWCNSCEIKGRCKLISGSCKKGCDCKKGFYRDSSERCIRESKCPSNSPPPTCPLPSCDEEGCEINYDAKPCPTCECVGKPIVRCSVPKCDVDCEINYETKPCPSCDCKKTGGAPPVSCSPPKCDKPGCRINYKTKPCPSCECRGVSCTLPKCDGPGCELDYETEPCPSCKCEISGAPPILCSPPKCDKPGCRINSETKPCPSCECNEVSCSMPICDGPGCEIDYDTKPCPSCKCENSSPPSEECGKDEEFYECRPTCKNTCENYKAKAPICPLICIKGCACKKGLVKRNDGKCVKPDKCDKIPDKCPPNEQYSDCANPCNDCQIKGKCNFLVCNKGCDCIKGHYRDESGKCIPEALCPPKSPSECAPDEQLYDCVPSCSRTCEKVLSKVKIYCSQLCKPGCFCKEGLVKGYDGKCVRPQECTVISAPPENCGKDEVYNECGSACPPTCSNLGKDQVCTLQCVQGCFCRKGLVRNDQGECVQPDQCPKSLPIQECKKGEEYYECIPTCKNTCENYQAENLICPRICIKGCACRAGLVKRKDGKCVTPEKCDNTPALPNQECKKGEEHYECIPTCKNTCENYQAENPICPRICIKGCACRAGLVKRKDGKCVTPEKCDNTPVPPIQKCGINEEYYDCVPTCKNTCENYNQKNVACPLYCKQGCGCKKGFVRRKDGKCVRPEKCDKKPANCGLRETYYECMPSCTNVCNPPDACAAVCRPGCFCRKDLVLREDGHCVKREFCGQSGQSTCDINEQYYDCIPDCGNTCNSYGRTDILCPEICKPGCFCKPGLVLNDENKCVKPEFCPRPVRECKNPDQQYYDCIPDCTNTCDNFGKTVACPKICKPGCFCKPGLVLNNENVCVKPKECPNSGFCKDKTMQYYECTPSCKNNCKSWFNPGIRCGCGPPGCFCKQGLVKREDGRCVRPEHCKKTGHHGSDTSGSETSSSSQTTENYDESSSDRTTSRSSSSQTTGYSDQNFVGSRSSQSSSTQSGSQSSQTSGQSIFESSGYQTGSQSSQTSGQSITQLTGYERGSQGSQTSSQSISESSGYGRGSQSSQTLGQSISELSGYQTGSQNSQTSGQSMSESSQYQQGSQISQTLGQSISESSGSQQGSSYQSGQSNTGSSSSSFVSQEGITSQLSQTVADSSSSSSSSSTAVGSISQILQSASESASSSTASQSGSSSQILQAVSESESSATALQSESSSDSESSNQVSSWFSTIKDESSSQTAQSESESLSSATAYQSGSSSQIAQSESESLSSATASQSGSSSQIVQSASESESSATAYQSGSSSQTAQSESESLSSATASQSATRSQRRKSSASSFSSASEKEIEFSQSESSSSSKGSEDQSSQSSSSSSISESSSDSESSNQVSSWFSTVKDDAESGNEQSQSESSYSSSGSQKEESSQNGESTSKSSTWSKGYTDGNKAKDGDDNGGFSSWSSGYKEENGVRTAEWDDSTSSWSSGSKND